MPICLVGFGLLRSSIIKDTASVLQAAYHKCFGRYLRKHAKLYTKSNFKRYLGRILGFKDSCPHDTSPHSKDFLFVSKKTQDEAFNQSMKKSAKGVEGRDSQGKSHGESLVIDLSPPTTKPACYFELEGALESNSPNVDCENKETFPLTTSKEALIQVNYFKVVFAI